MAPWYKDWQKRTQHLMQNCEEVKSAQARTEAAWRIKDNLKMRISPASNDPISSSYELFVVPFVKKSNYNIGWTNQTTLSCYDVLLYLWEPSLQWRISDDKMDQTLVSSRIVTRLNSKQ